MPAIIDHDAVKMNILAAFQSCIEERTITQIPLRMVAERAGMSHSKLLYYFKSKHELLVSYVRYTREYMTEKCVAWFAEHPRENYGSNLDYMNAFMEYVAVGKPGEVRPNATTQTYVLARYDDEIGRLVRAFGISAIPGLLIISSRAPPSKERKYERKPVFGLR